MGSQRSEIGNRKYGLPQDTRPARVLVNTKPFHDEWARMQLLTGMTLGHICWIDHGKAYRSSMPIREGFLGDSRAPDGMGDIPFTTEGEL